MSSGEAQDERMFDAPHKNILVVGTARAGKTSFARLLHERFGYNMISLDEIVESLKYGFPQLGVSSDTDETTTEVLRDFLDRYILELSESPTFAAGVRTVLETTHADIRHIAELISAGRYRGRWQAIGFVSAGETPEQMFARIREHDCEEDWTARRTDGQLMEDCRYFARRNGFFLREFEACGIPCFNTFPSREEAFREALKFLFQSRWEARMPQTGKGRHLF